MPASQVRNGTFEIRSRVLMFAPSIPATVNCPNVGWQAVLDTTLMADGRHTLEVIATSQQGPRAIRTVSFVASNANLWASRGQAIYIDTPSGAKGVSGTIPVNGWAVNKVDTVNALSIAVDGVILGSAKYGFSRPDVCAIFQSPYNCPNVGWASLDTNLLSNGSHVLQAIEYSGTGNAVTTRTITVSNGANSTTLCIDGPAVNGQYNGIARFGGWAIYHTSSIASLSVSVDGVPFRTSQLRNQPARCLQGLSEPCWLPERGMVVRLGHDYAFERTSCFSNHWNVKWQSELNSCGFVKNSRLNQLGAPLKTWR